MAEITRRSVLQGAAAAALVAAVPSAASAAGTIAADVAADQQVWKLHYVVRYIVEPVFQPSFAEGERVQVRFKNGKNDKRSFKASSLETGEGKVRFVIPPGAVPWRYVRGRWKEAPIAMHRKIERAKDWQRPGTGRLYVVGTPKGWVIVPANRMRSLAAPKIRLAT